MYTSDIVSGLAWVLNNAAKNNIKVVNLSLSETLPSNYQTDALDQACEALWKAGIVVVVASGNDGPKTAIYAPDNDPFLISVGATDTNDTLATSDDTVASFSTYEKHSTASPSPTSWRRAGTSSETSSRARRSTRWRRRRTTSHPAT